MTYTLATPKPVQAVIRGFIAAVDSIGTREDPFDDRPSQYDTMQTFMICSGYLSVLDVGKGLDCATAFVQHRVYSKLARIILTTDWDRIGQSLKSVGRDDQPHAPKFYHQMSLPDAHAAVGERLQQAGSLEEVAVLLLRLAMRAACVDASYFGPFSHTPALEQLGGTKLLGVQAALRALLPLFGRHLARHSNALHIVDDLLHIVYSVSEGAMQSADPLRIKAWAGLDILETVVKHAAQLPPWESGFSSQHTAMMLAPSIAAANLRVLEHSFKHAGELDHSNCMANASFIYSGPFLALLSKSLTGFISGHLPPNLGDSLDRLTSGEVDRGACWGVYRLKLALQQTTRGNPSLEFAHQQQSRLVDRVPWRMIKSMLDLCLASGEAEFIDWASPNMTMHAQKMGNALEIAAHLQTCIKKGLFLAASGLLTRCLRYLWRIVHASPPDAKALAGRHQLPYKATELWQRLMWQSMGPCLAAVYSHLMSPWQSFMANREVALIAALPWSTMAAVEADYMQVLELLQARADHVILSGGDAVLDGVFRTASRVQEPAAAAAVLEYAPAMSQALLCQAAPWQDPTDWLGLLISLRKYWAHQWELPAARPEPVRLLAPTVLLASLVQLDVPEGGGAIAAAQLLPLIERMLEQESARIPASLTFAFAVELLMLCSALAVGSAWPLLRGNDHLISAALQSTEVFCRMGAGEDPENPSLPKLPVWPTTLQHLGHLAGCMMVIQQLEGQLGATSERRTLTRQLASMIFCAICDVALHMPSFAGGSLSNNLTPLQTILPVYTCLSRQPAAKGLLPMMDYQYGRALRACYRQDGETGTPGGCMRQDTPRLRRAAEIIEAYRGAVGAAVDWREGREDPRYQAFERSHMRNEVARLCMHLSLEDVAVPAVPTGPAALRQALALEGRAALLAAKAGFCCNMRCPNISCARERHVKTYACCECEQKARYCSKACQRAAWAAHKLLHG